MNKKLKIDPKKVEYDGRSFRLIVEDEAELLKKLKEKQAEIVQDIIENDPESEPADKAVMLLQQAQDRVADHVDGIAVKEME